MSIELTGDAVAVPYTNDKGDRAVRRIVPERLYFGSTELHPEPQWILEAWDLDKHAIRPFALAGFTPEESP